MARIQAFRAILPHPDVAEQLLFGEQGNLLKQLLESGARFRPETPEGQQDAYHLIRRQLLSLMDDKKLYGDRRAGIYIYEITSKHHRQSGVWTQTNLKDYTDGTIKTHELTLPESERRLQDYREHTGLEGSPILLTYRPQTAINKIIAETKMGNCELSVREGENQHRLWKIDDAALISSLTAAFAQVRHVYLADGHHRLGSASKLSQVQQDRGQKPFDTIASLYVATDQLRIGEYHRLVSLQTPVLSGDLFNHLKNNFCMTKLPDGQLPEPKTRHQIGMSYRDIGMILTVIPPDDTEQNRPDARILQDCILEPVFGISDPSTDSRLKCIGGPGAVNELKKKLTEHPEAIAFTLYPLTIESLIHSVNTGEVLPPKSTWIEPKVPYGLILYQHIK